MQVQTKVRSDEHDTFTYAQLSGDWNDLHTDPDYVARDDTFCDENIVHGTHIIGWFSNLLNNIGHECDAEVVLVDIYTEFHNPLPVGREALVTATIDDEDMPTEDEPQVISTVGLRAVDPESEMEYTTGSATVMLNQSVGQSE